MHEERIREEFSHQSPTFDTAPVMSAAATLDALVEIAAPAAGGRWVELACGTGLVSRALAPHVGSVSGVDLTPAMVERARGLAAGAGLGNVTYEVGDATGLELGDGSVDGAITRFSLHHIPAPGRVLAEMARVVRSGGTVVVGDHVTGGDADAAAWHQEIERLRDPSHWACLTPERLLALGDEAGLKLEEQRLVPIEMDFDEWLARGSGGSANAALIGSLLADPPPGAAFVVHGERGARKLSLRYQLARWRRP